MFNITLSPVFGAVPIDLEKRRSALIVNGETFDFGFLADGDRLPREAVSGDWLASDVVRSGGEIQLTVMLPHGSNAPEETRFPSPITVTQDGPVALPPYDVPEDEV